MTLSTHISAFISLVCAFVACAPVPCAPVRDVVPEVVDATVALVVDLEDGGTATICSGVWVDPVHVATAGHCAEALARLAAGVDPEDGPQVDPIGLVIQYATQAETRGYHEAPSARHNAQVAAYDEAHDVAILTASSDAPRHRWGRLVPAPKLGAPLHLVGHDRGYAWTYMRGYACRTWAALPGAKEGPWFQVTAPVSNGMSGSGAWTEDGDLVGILSFYATQVPSTGFYVTSTIIARALAQAVGAH